MFLLFVVSLRLERRHYFLTFAPTTNVFIAHGIAATAWKDSINFLDLHLQLMFSLFIVLMRLERQHYFLRFALTTYAFIVHGISATGKTALFSKFCTYN